MAEMYKIVAFIKTLLMDFSITKKDNFIEATDFPK